MTYEDYLQHWGILGMKWGQRNGPPYPLGSSQMNSSEKRLFSKTKGNREKTPEEIDAEIARINKNKELKLAKQDAKIAAVNKKREFAEAKKDLKTAKKEASEKEININKLRNKNPKKMDQEELDAVLKRMNQEKQLRELNASSVKNGSKFVSGILAVGGTVALSTFISKIAKNWGENRGQRFWDNVINKKETDKANAFKKAEQDAFKDAMAKASVMAKTNNNYEDGLAGYNSMTNDMKNVVNYLMQVKGFDKPFKKDK